eukprot:scaffold106979_cov62-Phaeocystis_antarctica.AAC.2
MSRLSPPNLKALCGSRWSTSSCATSSDSLLAAVESGWVSKPRSMAPLRLQGGERIAAVHTLAEQLSTDGHLFVPTNPASVDPRHRLVRLRLPKGDLPFVNETVAVLVDDVCTHRFGPAQDPRAVWNGPHLFAFYSRVGDASRSIGSRPAEIRMAFRNLSEPASEVLLREPRSASPFKKFFNWEKNWTPFLHGGELLLSYRLEPHVVLGCDWRSGNCHVAHRTNASHVWAHHRTSVRMGARGSSPAVLLRSHGSYLGIAHFRTPSGTSTWP